VFHRNRDQLAACSPGAATGSLSGDRRANAVTKDRATVHGVVNVGYDGRTTTVAPAPAYPPTTSTPPS